MTTKLLPLDEAVRLHVRDGDTIFIGGFGQCIPFATAHETVRQGRRDLTLCRSGADILFDLMIAAGCVKKIIVGYVGNPGIGLAHAYRRAVEAGQLEVEHWTNFAMVLRLHAAALGVPFLPAATLIGGDLPAQLPLKMIDCPYTGEKLTAVPALVPDVAFIHAQYADAAGNVQLFGLSGDSLEGAMAAKKIVVTVEEIIRSETLRKRPDRTVIPGFRTSSVSLVPYGALPSYVEGFYGRDDETYAGWDKLARDPAALSAWIEKEINGRKDFAAFVEAMDGNKLEALRGARGRSLEGAP